MQQRDNGKNRQTEVEPVEQERPSLRELFNEWTDAITRAVGTPLALGLAALVVVVWLVSGPFASFSDTWQLMINTATTIVTFLMVFVIQNTQNRDAKAVHAKLDELIRAVHGARNEFVATERMAEAELDRTLDEFLEIAEERVRPRGRGAEDGAPGAAKRGRRAGPAPTSKT